MAVHRVLDEWIGEKQQKGLLEYTYSILSQDPYRIQIFEGPYYYYKAIQLVGINELYPQRAGIDRLYRKQEVVNWTDLEEKMESCLDQYQNEGYPFASFQQTQFKYIAHKGDSVGVEISYVFDSGPLVRIDSVIVKGKIRENANFVYNLSGLNPGDIYRHKLVRDAPRILNNSIYYEEVKDPRVKFRSDNKADIQLELEQKQTSRLDILLGILPPVDNTQRLQFTGSIDVALLSPIRRGELLEFKFEKLTQSSQQTRLALMMPYLLRTPLRLSGAFELLKQNEDFQNQSLDLAAQYDFSPFLSASFYLNTKNTRLLGESLVDTSLLDFPQLDSRRRMLGLGLNFENLDYRLNPSRGLHTSLKIGLGTRSIQENVQISRTRPEVYENIDREQPSREIDFRFKWYQQLIPRHVLHIANHTYWLDIEDILRNDQLQVGGARSIRGFNENQFFTDFYSFFSLEYRLQLERNSYVFVFGDYAYLENNEASSISRPISTGIGMNYGTKAGIISISYAIGKAENIPFQAARGRVHIGLINQF
ncbi:MAG: BamA/TamA family outer membrane protein [Bacteroidia bacterium]|nr:BamA/TamA family outer membrane protein [Bacteroidia bacterium]